MSERPIDTQKQRVMEQLFGAGTWEFEPSTLEVTWSEGARHLLELGVSAPSTLGAMLERIHPEDRARAEAVFDRALSRRTPFDIAHRLLFPDGRTKHVRHAGSPLEAEAGPDAPYYGVLEDVTERVHADGERRRSPSEIELYHSEELLKQAVHVSGIGIFDHDMVKDTIYWSPRQREIHGFELDEPLTLEKCAHTVHPDDNDRIGESVLRAHDPNGTGAWEVEYRIVRRDGGVRWLVARAQTFFLGEGARRRPIRTVGVVLDLTERKLAEEAMRIKDQAVATSLNATAITDEAGRIVYANPAFVRMSGYASESDVVGRSPDDFTDAESARRVIAALRSVGDFQGELAWRRRDGTSYAIILTANALRDADGKLTHMIASFLDISDAKRMQEQLHQAQKMESVGRLAGGIAHDFNNLLTVMRGYLDLAVLGLDANAQLRLDLDEVIKAVTSATALTRQLLSFSRGQVIVPQLLDLNEVVDRVHKMLGRVLGEDIELRLDLAPDLWPVRFDAGQFEQILINLAANARDAMPQGGSLRVETQNVHFDARDAEAHTGTTAGDYVLLAVTDDGSGMSKEVQGRIFEPFYTTKQLGLGTGLGLAMVYGAITQNSGHIEVFSEVSQGSCFKIYLPRGSGKAVRLALDAAPVVRPTYEETILLVEDDTTVRTLAARLLRQWGFRVHAFPDGPSAIAFASTTPETLDLLVTDVVMPGMNGRELAEKLVMLRPRLRVLFTSGYTADVTVHHGVLGEGVEFLPKPYTVDSLGKRVREILEKPASRT
jgi:two-component system, cell cycle sensor histidine kinase and response regulator CckA